MPAILSVLASAAITMGTLPDAPNAVESLLANMRKAYSSAKTASIQATVKNYTANGQASGRYSFRFKQPNLIRYVADVGQFHSERYCDGKEVVTIINAQRSSTRSINVDTLGARLPGNLEWLSFFDWKRQLSTGPGTNMAQSTFKLIPSETRNGRKWTVLEETAKPVNVWVRYFIDPKTFFIWRCEVSSISANKMLTETEIVKMELGIALDLSSFRPPP